ncbi:NfeD family protein [Candidatus Protochlamydia amoebophila]|uniref:NfeD family protein n=1 Tax=Candidatus Protochlamydia amoebophila TaxID=362787 RepID=UPI001BC91BAD|nr:NfeD family protein [Candidatus Protochlamydia amoebophila]
MTASLFLLCGLALIFIEFYIPGAIMGVLGSIFLIASIIVFTSQTNSIWATIFYIFFTFSCVVLLIRFTLWRIVHTSQGYSIYLKKDQKGFQASEYDRNAIGKLGIVLTDLKPGGYILIDGKQHQAISLTGYISKGEEVVVVSGQEESLIVKNLFPTQTI